MEENKIEEIKSNLDGADVFLRDRVNSKPAPLNEYDKAIMLDIAKTCDEAVKLIAHYESEIERLQSMNQAKLDMIHDIRAELETVRSEAITEFQAKVKENCAENPYLDDWVLETLVDQTAKELKGEQ